MALNRAERQPEPAGDLLVRQVRVERQLEDLSLRLPQPGQLIGQQNPVRHLKDTEQKADKVADDASNQWAQMRVDASTKMAEVKAKIDQRGTEIDAAVAQNDAEMAEADATAAIDYAGWAIDNARLWTLSALDARARADQLHKASNP